MPNDLLPMGMLKAGLLNWWYYTSNESERLPSVSLASFLLSFVLCIGRAVLCEEVVPHHPARFARSCEVSDNKQLRQVYPEKIMIRHNAINEQRVLDLLNANRPVHRGRIITADLIGSKNPTFDPDCGHFKKFLELENCGGEARGEAIKPFVDLIGNVPNQGVGRFVKPGVRYVALVPVSAIIGFNILPVKQFDVASPDQEGLMDIKRTLGVEVIDLASHCAPQLPYEVEQVEPPAQPNVDAQDQGNVSHSDPGSADNVVPLSHRQVAARARAPSPEVKGEPDRKKIKLEDPHKTSTLATASNSPDEKKVDVASSTSTSAVLYNSLTRREKAIFNMIKDLGLIAAQVYPIKIHYLQSKDKGRELEWGSKGGGWSISQGRLVLEYESSLRLNEGAGPECRGGPRARQARGYQGAACQLRRGPEERLGRLDVEVKAKSLRYYEETLAKPFKREEDEAGLVAGNKRAVPDSFDELVMLARQNDRGLVVITDGGELCSDNVCFLSGVHRGPDPEIEVGRRQVAGGHVGADVKGQVGELSCASTVGRLVCRVLVVSSSILGSASILGSVSILGGASMLGGGD
ncbi:uncharacterized protein PG986_006413 [Apiospora aurea]|uniref:Uncharacterized protein n=1 Tax=Apiospora aurea TaxID=335848 RepID=A0ABR1QLW0_9PEZI